jgi:phosphohistidine phosphatase
MPKLFIFRHGEALPGSPDFGRPLSEKGQIDINHLGRKLTELAPELCSHEIPLLSSPSIRTTETTQLLLSGLNNPNITVNFIEEGYLADPATWMKILEKISPLTHTCIIVGHNPGVTELVNILSGSYITMTPGTCVSMELLINDWSELFDGTGNVLDVYKP